MVYLWIDSVYNRLINDGDGHHPKTNGGNTMDRNKLMEMVEKKKAEATKRAEEKITKIKERAAEQVKKAEEKAASIEIDEEKLAKAVEIDEQIKALQEEKKGLGLGRTIGVAKGPRPKSISGNYPSVRAFAEEMFELNPEVTAKEMEEAVKNEFTDSRFTKNDFNWLKNKIVYHGEIKTR